MVCTLSRILFFLLLLSVLVQEGADAASNVFSSNFTGQPSPFVFGGSLSNPSSRSRHAVFTYVIPEDGALTIEKVEAVSMTVRVMMGPGGTLTIRKCSISGGGIVVISDGGDVLQVGGCAFSTNKAATTPRNASIIIEDNEIVGSSSINHTLAGNFPADSVGPPAADGGGAIYGYAGIVVYRPAACDPKNGKTQIAGEVVVQRNSIHIPLDQIVQSASRSYFGISLFAATYTPLAAWPDGKVVPVVFSNMTVFNNQVRYWEPRHNSHDKLFADNNDNTVVGIGVGLSPLDQPGAATTPPLHPKGETTRLSVTHNDVNVTAPMLAYGINITSLGDYDAGGSSALGQFVSTRVSIDVSDNELRTGSILHVMGINADLSSGFRCRVDFAARKNDIFLNLSVGWVPRGTNHNGAITATNTEARRDFIVNRGVGVRVLGNEQLLLDSEKSSSVNERSVFDPDVFIGDGTRMEFVGNIDTTLVGLWHRIGLANVSYANVQIKETPDLLDYDYNLWASFHRHYAAVTLEGVSVMQHLDVSHVTFFGRPPYIWKCYCFGTYLINVFRLPSAIKYVGNITVRHNFLLALMTSKVNLINVENTDHIGTIVAEHNNVTANGTNVAMLDVAPMFVPHRGDPNTVRVDYIVVKHNYLNTSSVVNSVAAGVGSDFAKLVTVNATDSVSVVVSHNYQESALTVKALLVEHSDVSSVVIEHNVMIVKSARNAGVFLSTTMIDNAVPAPRLKRLVIRNNVVSLKATLTAVLVSMSVYSNQLQQIASVKADNSISVDFSRTFATNVNITLENNHITLIAQMFPMVMSILSIHVPSVVLRNETYVMKVAAGRPAFDVTKAADPALASLVENLPLPKQARLFLASSSIFGAIELPYPCSNYSGEYLDARSTERELGKLVPETQEPFKTLFASMYGTGAGTAGSIDADPKCIGPPSQTQSLSETETAGTSSRTNTREVTPPPTETPTPTIPLPVFEPPPTAQVFAGASSVFAVASGLTQSPATYYFSKKVMAISAMKNCPMENVQQVPPADFGSNPLMMEIGGDGGDGGDDHRHHHAVASWRGSIVGNFILGLCFCLVFAIVVFVVYYHRKSNNKKNNKIQRAMRDTRFPGSIFVILTVLGPAAATAFGILPSSVVGDEKTGLNIFLMVFGIVTLVALPAAILFWIGWVAKRDVKCIVKERAPPFRLVFSSSAASTDDPSSNKATTTNNTSNTRRNINNRRFTHLSNEDLMGGDSSLSSTSTEGRAPLEIIGAYLAAVGNYLNDPWVLWKKSAFSDKWMLLSETYRMPLFAAVDFLVAVLIGAVSGVAFGCTSHVCCHSVSVVPLVLAVGHGVAIFFLKPFVTRFDVVFNWFSVVVTVLLSILIVVVTFSKNTESRNSSSSSSSSTAATGGGGGKNSDDDSGVSVGVDAVSDSAQIIGLFAAAFNIVTMLLVPLYRSLRAHLAEHKRRQVRERNRRLDLEAGLVSVASLDGEDDDDDDGNDLLGTRARGFNNNNNRMSNTTSRQHQQQQRTNRAHAPSSSSSSSSSRQHQNRFRQETADNSFLVEMLKPSASASASASASSRHNIRSSTETTDNRRSPTSARTITNSIGSNIGSNRAATLDLFEKLRREKNERGQPTATAAAPAAAASSSTATRKRSSPNSNNGHDTRRPIRDYDSPRADDETFRNGEVDRGWTSGRSSLQSSPPLRRR